MLILTQDGQRVVKFKDITDLYVSCDDPIIYCSTYNDKENEYGIILGFYKDKERCKEVLKMILNKYESLKQYKSELKYYTNRLCTSLTYVSSIFNMPEE